MADLGLVGGVAGRGDRPWVEWMRDVLDGLPPQFTTWWGSDHLQQYGEPWPEGWTRLTYLAASAPRFRFGHLVLSQSFRHPGLLAAMASMLQELSGGRFILGLGAGWMEEEYRAFGYDYPSGGTRVAQLAECIEIVRALWTGEPVTHEGHWHQLRGAVGTKPVVPIPVLVGTNGPKALEVVARHADWWNWDGPWDMTYREPYDRLRAACAEFGRPFEEITLTASLAVSMPDDPRTFEGTYTHDFYPGLTLGRVGPKAADVIREIEILVDHGVRHLQLDFESRHELDRFASEVVPNVRLDPR